MTAGPRHRSFKVTRGVAIVVFAALAMSLLAWLGLPPLVKHQLESRLGAASGRQVAIGAVRFDPWRLALTIEDLRIADVAAAATAGAPPLLVVARMSVDFAATSLLELAPVIDALTIDGVRLRITRFAPGRYDVDDIVRRWEAPARTEPSAAAPIVRFALSNARLRDAAVRFDDRPVGRVQEVTALDLTVPFISNFATKLEVQVTPRLAFKLNGTPFDSDALATPFAATHAGKLKLTVRSLDLAPYLPYVPTSLPVRVASGVLATDLELHYAAPPATKPTFEVRGTVSMDNFSLTAAAGGPLVAWRRASAEIRSAELFSRRLALSSVRVEGAEAHVRRTASGALDWPTDGRGAMAPSPGASMPMGGGSSVVPGVAVAADKPWQVELDRVDLVDAAVGWDDAAVRPAAALRLSGLTVGIDRVRWPLREPLQFEARASLQRHGVADPSGGRLSVHGSATGTSASLQASVEAVPLDGFEGYLAQALVPRVGGRASAQANVDWSSADGTRVSLSSASIDDFTLHPSENTALEAGATAPPFAVRRFWVREVAIDLATHDVKVGRLGVEGPSVALLRETDGALAASRWLARAEQPPAEAPAAPWKVEVAQASLTGGELRWTDASLPGRSRADPVRLALADFHLELRDWSWQGDRAMVPAHFTAGGRVGFPLAPGEPASRIPGNFDWRGVVGVAPLEVIGSLKAERLPVHLAMPYLGASLPFRIAHLELGIDGQTAVRRLATGFDVDAGADILLGAMRVETLAKPASRSAADTLLSWNTLGLKGVRVAVKAGARPQVAITEAALGDFYSRLLVTEDGRLNIRDLAASTGSAPPPAPAASAPRPAAAASSALPIDVRLGGMTLANGRIDFSDHYVRPNYSAALTELNGRLGALDSTRPAMTPLTLRGKAAATAQLEIDGSVDPLGQPPTLDLRAKATDLELAPLSPYAGKYAGYAIERGKLSVEVAYRLGPDGRLDATNRVVLNQLTFGHRIESPTATSLPVLFAVSLLKDRNGVIDLDLPIRGSLNDPQFSVAAIVGRLLGNLLTKAITSPFSLLARAASSEGAAGDPARVAFEPGTSRLAPAGVDVVETVGRALAGKPDLLLTITGSADTAREQDAYRTALLDERIAAVRRNATVASAAAASATLPPLTDDDRNRWVRQLYRDTDLPDKPRNLFGFAADLPVAEMEARLKAAIEVNADTARGLALQRGVGVRDALIAKGLPGDRLFLAAPQVDDAGAPAAEARLALTAR